LSKQGIYKDIMIYIVRSTLVALLSVLVTCNLTADEVEIVDAKASRTGEDSYRFDVSIRHADIGWKHYANQWQLYTSDGQLLGTRTLHHPHVDEQPFTRSLDNIKVPQGVISVVIRAKDSVHGMSPQKFELVLP
jgi:hypothetical protein